MIECKETLIDVLIVDDDALSRQSLRWLLEEHGYICTEADNGREAVEAARRQSPRCVLLDLVMPEMDGFAVAQTLRADPRTREAHIHCLTGLEGPEVRQRAQEAGCELFLTKPVPFQAVLQAMPRPAQQEERTVSGLTLAQAEQLLDWLENRGWTPVEVVLQAEGVQVRYIA